MPINRLQVFKNNINSRLLNYKKNKKLANVANKYFDEIGYHKAKNVYNYFWCGLPIIQHPQDLQSKQELIWEYKPEIIIETGVAWGGSLLFYSTLLGMLSDCELIENPKVIGVEKNLKTSNRKYILSHPLSKRIQLIDGSSTSKKVIDQISGIVYGKKVMIILDSNHTHKHVLKELYLYSKFCKKDGYIVVEDTSIETQKNHPKDRNWGKGNSPLSAIREFISNQENKYIVDDYYTKKSIISGMHGGILKKL